jgi:hypothetical protein
MPAEAAPGLDITELDIIGLDIGAGGAADRPPGST